MRLDAVKKNPPGVSSKGKLLLYVKTNNFVQNLSALLFLGEPHKWISPYFPLQFMFYSFIFYSTNTNDYILFCCVKFA